MKTLIFSILFLSRIFAGSSIYDLTATDIKGSTINFSAYKGEKMVIYEFDANNLDTLRMKYLDSLQTSNTNFQVFAFPVMDFNATSIELVKSRTDSLRLHFPILQPAMVRKKTGSGQQRLFKWLTNVAGNSHFDYDVNQSGQSFIVNENGTLYAVINPGTPNDVFNKILNQEPKL